MLGECKEVEFLLKHSLSIALNLNYFERDTVALSHPTTHHPTRLQLFARFLFLFFFPFGSETWWAWCKRVGRRVKAVDMLWVEFYNPQLSI
jgi:hypothetical protein